MSFPLESLEQMQGFFWVLMRISIIIFLLPLFGARGIPMMWKAGFSFIIAMILTPVVPAPNVFPETLPELVLGMISEMIMGLVLSLGIKMLFTSVQMAGQFLSFQMGFAMAQAMDPQTGVQSMVLTQLLYLFTILIFFSCDGHHLFIHALAASFEIVPPNSLQFHPQLSVEVTKISGMMFLLGLKIAAPIVVALFLSNLCLGIVARTVPQVNILMVGFPINISIGLILFSLIVMNFFPVVSGLIQEMGESLNVLLRLM
ncbi:MAG: flagellar type III secretion system protein FliR [Deltaproteobacteria bacterium]|nr:flagellar type III secretion system protein FliR [Deltaproteobacteria bacterium]